MRRWDALVDRYVGECEARGLSASTLYVRARELERCGAWLKRRRPRPPLEEVSSDHLIGYIRARTAFRSKSTVCGVTSILRNMGEHLVQAGLWRQNPLRWIRGPKLDGRRHVPRRIGRDQMERMWKAADAVQPRERRSLLLAILAVVYGTGLRKGELERLNLSDWNREEGMLRIDGQKTGVERRVPVSAGVWKCVEAYLPLRHNLLEQFGRLAEPALFVNRSGQRLKGPRISDLAHRLARQAGVPMVSLHQFRHSCASDLLEGGASLPEVQKILGHACVTTTLRYTQITDPQRQAAMRRHPVNEFLSQPDGRAIA
jgi:site-specific recombinase XerD